MPAALNRRLRAQAARLGVSLASLCHLGWALVLSRSSHCEQGVFGTVLLGRSGAESEDMVGLLINTLPVRVDINGTGAQEAVRAVHARLGALLAHEQATLSLAQQCSGVVGEAPLFNALLNYRHNQSNETTTEIEGVQWLDEQERSNYPVTLSVEDDGETLGVTVQAVAPLEPARVGGYMAQALLSLVTALETTPQKAVCELPILPTAERKRVLYDWNATGVDYPQGECLHRLFEQQVQRTPHAMAVTADDGVLSYAALNDRANRLAHYLRAQGVGPDERVAVCAERSSAMVVALLGILKAGGAYVPLDPGYPRERLNYILGDAVPTLLLADARGLQVLGTPSVSVIPLEDVPLLTGELPAGDLTPASAGLSANHLAYVIYTSGSSGQPKGVMVEHRQVVNLCQAQGALFSLTTDSRVLQFASACFDASIFEIVMALGHGGTLIIVPDDIRQDRQRLAGFIRQYGVTHATFPPALFGQRYPDDFSTLQYVVFAGESPSAALLQGAAETAVVFNAYGPTETAVCATALRYEPANPLHSERAIGTPIANTQIYLLDPQGEPVPVGAVGELYIGGVQVARGYLNRPALTAERFLADPFSAEPGARMYRSGDLARWLPDGTVEYLGRNDEQVKIRGFRVEPGEVAARLAAHPQVREAVVLARGEGALRHLAAWWVPKTEETACDAAALHAWLAGALPDYMVPRSYVRLDALPLTPNGKLDKRALPAPTEDARVRGEYEAPQGDMETALAAQWCALLGLDQVGRHDSFFMLGGHSLLAMRLVSRLRRAGYALSLQAVFAAPVLTDMAKCIYGAPAYPSDKAIAVRTEGHQAPLFFLPSGFGDYSYVYELARFIDNESPIYALPWPAGLAEKGFTLAKVVGYAVAMLRRVQPHGPYHLAGYSSGGLLAWSIARHLRENGEKIAFVGLIDTLLPEMRHSASEAFAGEAQSPSAAEIREEADRIGLNMDLINAASIQHHARLVADVDVTPTDIDVYLFKAKEEYMDENTSWFKRITQRGYTREDASALLWDTVLEPERITVTRVNGNHVTLLTDAGNRQALGAHISASLKVCRE
ncbi:non-ribosomal peptide synthetase [Serratia symbiotica]|uniref:Amino acid adenylation domain-containing protein n=2 Tax=Serratia symbiotica TaxID=138074 RepID=A0A7D5NND4_9GAMM|nr:non-ribosomal peptide synthetase [Serratia symbiotica]QLH62426.1 amino acid adenylation domain-containing protein [Serratia symbiotica]